MLRKIAVMFSFIAMIIAIYIPAMAAPLSQSSDDTFLGDVNNSGDVSAADLQLVSGYILGLKQFSCMEMLKADTDGDRDIDMSDLLRIQDHILFDQEFAWGSGRGLGDVNQDGKVSLLDLHRVNKHINGQITLSGQALRNANVNGNRGVDRRDLILLQQCFIGTLDQLPAFHG